MRVLMLSGGLDSCVCLYRDTFDLALCIDYGQPHIAEVHRAKSIAAGRGVPFEIVRVGWSVQPTVGLLGGHDTTPDLAVVPGRNALFVGLAACRGATRVTLGCNADDYAAFADCRPEVLGPVAAACGVQLDLPLAGMTKAQVIALAREIGAPAAVAMSCYRGRHPGCGECAACVLRDSATPSDDP